MIEYIISENPDDRIIRKAMKLLQDGQVISFPTDTTWVLAISPFHKGGIENIRRVKSMDKNKHLTLLCHSLSQISIYSEVSDFAYKILKKCTPGAYTFILNPSKDLPKYIKSYRKDGQIGVKISNSILCNRLVEMFDGPLLITSITPEILKLDTTQDIEHFEFFSETIYGYQVEDSLGGYLKMILDPGEVQLLGESTVVDLTTIGEINVLREGSGDLGLL